MLLYSFFVVVVVDLSRFVFWFVCLLMAGKYAISTIVLPLGHI